MSSSAVRTVLPSITVLFLIRLGTFIRAFHNAGQTGEACPLMQVQGLISAAKFRWRIDEAEHDRRNSLSILLLMPFSRTQSKGQFSHKEDRSGPHLNGVESYRRRARLLLYRSATGRQCGDSISQISRRAVASGSSRENGKKWPFWGVSKQKQ